MLSVLFSHQVVIHWAYVYVLGLYQNNKQYYEGYNFSHIEELQVIFSLLLTILIIKIYILGTSISPTKSLGT